MALTLYGSTRSRASMPRWYLEEHAIPYHWENLDLQTGEHRQEPYTTTNPFTKVPALVDDSIRAPGGKPLKLFENGASLLHPGEQHTNELGGRGSDGDPAHAAARRALASQWILFANSTRRWHSLYPATGTGSSPA